MDHDEPYVSFAIDGDRTAFDELVRRHRGALHRLAYAVTQDHHEAEDLVQETFIRAYRAIARFRRDSSFRTWLHRIATNVIRTHRARRAAAGTPLVLLDEAGEDDERAIERCGSAEDLELTIVQRRMIDQALDVLPPSIRQALVLRDVQGLEYHEIARLTGAPLGTIESRIFRARRRLRPMLQPLRERRVVGES